MSLLKFKRHDQVFSELSYDADHLAAASMISRSFWAVF
jgi:hypothetical protein